MADSIKSKDRSPTSSEAVADLITRMEGDDELASAYAIEEKFRQAWKALEEVAEAISGEAFPDEIEWSDVTLTREEALAKFEAADDELRYIDTYLRQHARDHFAPCATQARDQKAESRI